jgi:hypothetical protein
MKTRKFFGFLMVLASGFLFVNCTSDPIPGPPGADGQDGIDGVDGQDGVSGTASCVACHNNTLRSEIAAGFAVSAHASGSVGFAENRVGCAQCHGSAGFIEFIETGAAAGPFSGDNTISCNTCHSSHRTFDFENDGPDYALRNPDPTQLVLAPSITLDFGDASNNCISCHQPRDSYEIPTTTSNGLWVINTSRFGPHHGPQSTVLEGILGAEITFNGAEAYPAPGTAAHRNGASCVACHMGPSDDPEIGGHSWTPIEANCIECHGAVPGEANGFSQDMALLKSLLEQVVGEEFATDADGNPVFDADGNPVGTGVPVVGLIVDFGPDDTDRSNQGIFSDVAAQAAWNYKTALEDQSRGIHNPEYTKALLKNSIQALQNEN